MVFSQSLKCLLLVAFFQASVDSKSTTQVTSTFSNGLCTTDHGSRKVVPVPRTTASTIIHSHTSLTTTITPSTTVTPGTSTSTTTITSTAYTTSTLPTVTDRFTTTITSTTTLTQTSTDLETKISTTTSTTTIAIDSTTIAEAPGFTPIQAGVTGASKMRRGGANLPSEFNNKRAPADLRMMNIQALPAVDADGRAVTAKTTTTPTSYPTRVGCNSTVTLYTMTITTATASTLTSTAATPIMTSSTTITSTSTIYSTPADVSSTVTQYTTENSTTATTVTTTTTSISTTTVTKFNAAVTSYAVCEDHQNYISSVNGNGIVGYAYTITASTTTAHDCCVVCQSLPDCIYSVYDSFHPNCYLLNPPPGNTCSPSTYGGKFYTFPYASGLNLSNSNCGFLSYGGPSPFR